MISKWRGGSPPPRHSCTAALCCEKIGVRLLPAGLIEGTNNQHHLWHVHNASVAASRPVTGRRLPFQHIAVPLHPGFATNKTREANHGAPT